jgi:hypothetical protein
MDMCFNKPVTNEVHIDKRFSGLYTVLLLLERRFGEHVTSVFRVSQGERTPQLC